MIGLSRRVRVFAYTRPVDMRKQYDGLYALVVAELKADPLSGDLFLFTNRRRKAGAAWAMIARETGLDVRKLQRWNTRARRTSSVPVLRPVEVLTEPEPTEVLTVIAPSDVRVEGLALEQAAQLLRLLA